VGQEETRPILKNKAGGRGETTKLFALQTKTKPKPLEKNTLPGITFMMQRVPVTRTELVGEYMRVVSNLVCPRWVGKRKLNKE